MELVTMFKKLSAALFAISLVAVAQPASAQANWNVVAGSPLAIVSVTLRTATTPASVTGQGGFVWSFNGLPNGSPGTVEEFGATLNGKAVFPKALGPGMRCEVNGRLTSQSSGVITKIACIG